MSNRLTLEQIAEKSGVSRSTVSRVVRNHPSVSPAVRERVLEVIKETGYQPNAAARSLAGQRTNVIGLVIAESAQSLFTDAYYPMLIQGVTQATNDYEQTLTLFLFHNQADEEKLSPRLIRNQLVDGLVVTGTRIDDPIVPRLLESEVPFVLVGRHEDPRVSFIDVDNVAGAQAAVSYLIRLGYKRIGMITGTMQNRSAIDRCEGYKQALRSRGIPIDEEIIVEGNFTEYSGYACLTRLLEKSVDAVFVSSDGMAVGALRAARDAGKTVPSDIAIVSFDDLPTSGSTQPPLTTVRQSVRRTGAMAVETLLDILESGQQPPRRISLPTELIVRATCGGTRA